MKKLLLIIAIIVILAACTSNNPPVNNSQQNITKECSSDSDCMKSGCSGQLCIPKTNANDDGFTICDFKPEYECYSNQNCICKNSKCGWSDAEGLNKCITEKSKIIA